MIVMRESSNDGGARWCSAKCYDAKGKVCRCICEGVNHGTGLNKAIDNMKLVAQKILDLTLPRTTTFPSLGIKTKSTKPTAAS